MPFKVGSNGGDLCSIFLTEYDVINQFTGHELWMWGLSKTGGLGLNGTAPRTFGVWDSRSSPVQTISGGTNWKQISPGGDTYSFTSAIKTDGTLWTWGSNYGKLGDNTAIYRSSPVQTVAGGTNWKSVCTGLQSAFAIKTDGTLWGWGCNGEGCLGDNTTIPKSSPVQVVGNATNWKCVSTDGGVVVGLKTDGTLWTWGRGYVGALGDNTTISKSSPVQTIAGGTNWRTIAGGGYMASGIKTDGTLWLWGRSVRGGLGDNTTIRKSSPVQTIAGGTNWKQISIRGYAAAAAIKTDGSLWVWGRNCYGRLGNNSTIDASSPVQTIAGGTNWRSVTTSPYNTAGIKIDGTLWVWGRNGNCVLGIVGDNTINSRSSPVQTIAVGTNWRTLSLSTSSIGALRLFNGYDF
jgi:alpha-tubulin suppressor-like RCC1 family protein